MQHIFQTVGGEAISFNSRHRLQYDMMETTLNIQETFTLILQVPLLFVMPYLLGILCGAFY